MSTSLNQKNQTIPSKNRPDRAIKIRTTFDRLRIDCFDPSTVLLLLKSCEETIVQRAIISLDKFGAKAIDNLNVLYEMNAHKHIIPLFEASDLYTRRFAIKLLAELSTLREVRKEIAEDVEFTLKILKFFSEEDDLVNNEFGGMMIAELSQEATLVDQLLNTNILDILFIRMQSPDPDTQKHSLQILLNLQMDPFIKNKILSCSSFNFVPLLSHTLSPYPIIQKLTLKIMRRILENIDEKLLQSMFLKSKGLETLIRILESNDYKDLHKGCLKILQVSALNPETTAYIYEKNMSGFLIIYLKEIQDPILEELTLFVFINMTQFPLGRLTLFDSGLVQILIHYVNHEISTLSGTACSGIAHLSSYKSAVTEISESSIATSIFKILINQFRSWKTRIQAAFAICQLTKYDVNTAFNFVNQGKVESLYNLMNDKNTPLEMVEILLQCLINLLQIPTIRSTLANSELINTLVNSVIKKDEEMPEKLLLLGFETLTIALCEKEACKAFRYQKDIEKTILNYLLTLNIPLRVQVMSLMLNACRNEDIALGFIHLGAIEFIYANKTKKNHLPMWNELLEVLYKAHLPTKFAYTNRLEVSDITKEGFYIYRRTPNKNSRKLSLKTLLKNCSMPRQIIYVANFQNKSPQKEENEGEEEGNPEIPNNEETQMTDEELNDKIHEIYGKCLFDDGLPEALKQLNLLFDGKISGPLDNKPIKACTIQDRARILAEFVCSELSGPNEEAYTKKQLIDLHVTYLKVELSTSILPIGRLKVGQYIERAMLFKVLADRINLPCCLVRGNYGHAWVEIALVEEKNNSYLIMDVNTLDTISFPKRLLRPNYVVNLMDKPGNLLAIGSSEADIYCANVIY